MAENECGCETAEKTRKLAVILIRGYSPVLEYLLSQVESTDDPILKDKFIFYKIMFSYFRDKDIAIVFNSDLTLLKLFMEMTILLVRSIFLDSQSESSVRSNHKSVAQVVKDVLNVLIGGKGLSLQNFYFTMEILKWFSSSKVVSNLSYFKDERTFIASNCKIMDTMLSVNKFQSFEYNIDNSSFTKDLISKSDNNNENDNSLQCTELTHILKEFNCEVAKIDSKTSNRVRPKTPGPFISKLNEDGDDVDSFECSKDVLSACNYNISGKKSNDESENVAEKSNIPQPESNASEQTDSYSKILDMVSLSDIDSLLKKCKIFLTKTNDSSNAGVDQSEVKIAKPPDSGCTSKTLEPLEADVSLHKNSQKNISSPNELVFQDSETLASLLDIDSLLKKCDAHFIEAKEFESQSSSQSHKSKFTELSSSNLTNVETEGKLVSSNSHLKYAQMHNSAVENNINLDAKINDSLISTSLKVPCVPPDEIENNKLSTSANSSPKVSDLDVTNSADNDSSQKSTTNDNVSSTFLSRDPRKRSKFYANSLQALKSASDKLVDNSPGHYQDSKLSLHSNNVIQNETESNLSDISGKESVSSISVNSKSGNTFISDVAFHQDRNAPSSHSSPNLENKIINPVKIRTNCKTKVPENDCKDKIKSMLLKETSKIYKLGGKTKNTSGNINRLMKMREPQTKGYLTTSELNCVNEPTVQDLRSKSTPNIDNSKSESNICISSNIMDNSDVIVDCSNKSSQNYCSKKIEVCNVTSATVLSNKIDDMKSFQGSMNILVDFSQKPAHDSDQPINLTTYSLKDVSKSTPQLLCPSNSENVYHPLDLSNQAYSSLPRTLSNARDNSEILNYSDLQDSNNAVLDLRTTSRSPSSNLRTTLDTIIEKIPTATNVRDKSEIFPKNNKSSSENVSPLTQLLPDNISTKEKITCKVDMADTAVKNDLNVVSDCQDKNNSNMDQNQCLSVREKILVDKPLNSSLENSNTGNVAGTHLLSVDESDRSLYKNHFLEIGCFVMKQVSNCKFGFECGYNNCTFKSEEDQTFIDHIELDHGNAQYKWNCYLCEEKDIETHTLLDLFQHILIHLADSYSSSERGKQDCILKLLFFNEEDPTEALRNELVNISNSFFEKKVNSRHHSQYHSHLETDNAVIETYEYLSHAFKCMVGSCKFSSNDLVIFKEHCEDHHRNTQRSCISDTNEKMYYCRYCSIPTDNPTDHVIENHGSSVFQCPFCYFRAYSALSVVAHEMHHKSYLLATPVVLVCMKKFRRTVSSFPPVCVLKPYRCSSTNCKFTSFITSNFVDHLWSHSTRILSCFECGAKYDNLIIYFKHLMYHGIGKYHCAFCSQTFRDASFAVLHVFLIHQHFPSKLIIRYDFTTYKPMASRYFRMVKPFKAGCEQLMEVDMDSVKCQNRLYFDIFTQKRGRKPSKIDDPFRDFNFNCIKTKRKIYVKIISETPSLRTFCLNVHPIYEPDVIHEQLVIKDEVDIHEIFHSYSWGTNICHEEVKMSHSFDKIPFISSPFHFCKDEILSLSPPDSNEQETLPDASVIENLFVSRFKCYICLSELYTLQELYEHFMSDHTDSPIQFEIICVDISTHETNSSLINKLLICFHCNKVVCNEAGLINHFENCHRNSFFKYCSIAICHHCPFCDHIFLFMSDLISHCHDWHEQIYLCDSCNLWYTRSDYMSGTVNNNLESNNEVICLSHSQSKYVNIDLCYGQSENHRCKSFFSNCVPSLCKETHDFICKECGVINHRYFENTSGRKYLRETLKGDSLRPLKRAIKSNTSGNSAAKKQNLSCLKFNEKENNHVPQTARKSTCMKNNCNIASSSSVSNSVKQTARKSSTLQSLKYHHEKIDLTESTVCQTARKSTTLKLLQWSRQNNRNKMKTEIAQTARKSTSQIARQSVPQTARKSTAQRLNTPCSLNAAKTVQVQTRIDSYKNKVFPNLLSNYMETDVSLLTQTSLDEPATVSIEGSSFSESQTIFKLLCAENLIKKPKVGVTDSESNQLLHLSSTDNFLKSKDLSSVGKPDKGSNSSLPKYNVKRLRTMDCKVTPGGSKQGISDKENASSNVARTPVIDKYSSKTKDVVGTTHLAAANSARRTFEVKEPSVSELNVSVKTGELCSPAEQKSFSNRKKSSQACKDNYSQNIPKIVNNSTGGKIKPNPKLVRKGSQASKPQHSTKKIPSIKLKKELDSSKCCSSSHPREGKILAKSMIKNLLCDIKGGVYEAVQDPLKDNNAETFPEVFAVSINSLLDSVNISD